MTIAPAKIIGVDKGHLSIGADADIAIFDLNAEWVVDEKKFLSKGKNSPFIGKKLTGKAMYTIIDGAVRFEKGNIVRS